MIHITQYIHLVNETQYKPHQRNTICKPRSQFHVIIARVSQTVACDHRPLIIIYRSNQGTALQHGGRCALFEMGKKEREGGPAQRFGMKRTDGPKRPAKDAPQEEWDAWNKAKSYNLSMKRPANGDGT